MTSDDLNAREAQEQLLRKLFEFIDQGNMPEGLTSQQKVCFPKRSSLFSIINGQWMQTPKWKPLQQVILDFNKQQQLMKEAHDDFGHCGTHAVFETL
jgi:hypothetical protein